MKCNCEIYKNKGRLTVCVLKTTFLNILYDVANSFYTVNNFPTDILPICIELEMDFLNDRSSSLFPQSLTLKKILVL